MNRREKCEDGTFYEITAKDIQKLKNLTDIQDIFFVPSHIDPNKAK
mgnify:CR=1 FL=1